MLEIHRAYSGPLIYEVRFWELGKEIMLILLASVGSSDHKIRLGLAHFPDHDMREIFYLDVRPFGQG